MISTAFSVDLRCGCLQHQDGCLFELPALLILGSLFLSIIQLFLPAVSLPCLLGVHTCFVCKTSGENVKRCLLPLCGKYYHEECIQKYPPTVMQNKGFRCSLHICMTCHAANPANVSASKGRVLLRRPSWKKAFSIRFSSSNVL